METPLIEGKLSLRTAPTGEIILKNVIVKEEALLPKSRGLNSPLACLDSARFGIAWGALGAAQSCYEIALNYAKQRVQFGKPIASTQLVQQKLVNMHTEINLALQACLRMSRIIDDGKGSPELISLMKRNSAQKALEIARTARDILGGNGILDEYQVIRHMVNLETVNTYEGTHDIHTLILGRALTGMSAFK
jgi:glutaryl-CoA dehydrogenase